MPRTSQAVCCCWLITLLILQTLGCAASTSGPSDSGASCSLGFMSTGCADNRGIILEISRTSTSIRGNYDVYVNTGSCKHPGSPVCFGPCGSPGFSTEVVALRMPLLTQADIYIVPQGQSFSSACVWRSVSLNTCQIQRIQYNGACG
jgi:hypothetical protein